MEARAYRQVACARGEAASASPNKRLKLTASQQVFYHRRQQAAA
jgi:hypothetical protein